MRCCRLPPRLRPPWPRSRCRLRAPLRLLFWTRCRCRPPAPSRLSLYLLSCRRLARPTPPSPSPGLLRYQLSGLRLRLRQHQLMRASTFLSVLASRLNMVLSRPPLLLRLALPQSLALLLQSPLLLRLPCPQCLSLPRCCLPPLCRSCDRRSLRAGPRSTPSCATPSAPRVGWSRRTRPGLRLSASEASSRMGLPLMTSLCSLRSSPTPFSVVLERMGSSTTADRSVGPHNAHCSASRVLMQSPTIRSPSHSLRTSRTQTLRLLKLAFVSLPRVYCKPCYPQTGGCLL